MIIRFLHIRVSALIVLPDVLHTLPDGLERQEVQPPCFGLSVQEDTPEQTFRVVTDIDKVKAVPVLFDFPDEILVGRELPGLTRLDWVSNLFAP